MSFAISDSTATVTYPNIQIPSKLAETITQEASDEITYTHTNRIVYTIIDFPNSKADTEAQNTDFKIFTQTQQDQDEYTYAFAGPELMWNNKFRLHALKNGIENFLPQILYIMRPETAYTAALHYVAREIGGVEGYLDQRKFIFQNPGIRNILTHFWEKIQHITWSGGFSPTLSSSEKTQILLAHQKEGIDRTKKSSAIRTKKVPYGLEDFAPIFGKLTTPSVMFLKQKTQILIAHQKEGID